MPSSLRSMKTSAEFVLEFDVGFENTPEDPMTLAGSKTGGELWFDEKIQNPEKNLDDGEKEFRSR